MNGIKGLHRLKMKELKFKFVELKATFKLVVVHFVVVLNYLKAFKQQIGLLNNFGGKSLTIKILTLNIKTNGHGGTLEGNSVKWDRSTFIIHF